MQKIEKTMFYSWKLGRLAKGCRLCVQGRKSVLFITGICRSGCYYCPISDEKKNKDVVYINEVPNAKEKDIINEIRLCSSKGAGITGGDPLARINRTASIIKKLKNDFGKSFHIHLYTPLNLATKENLKKLWCAGLDEIRFHPNIDDESLWDRIIYAKEYSWDIGAEIPAIPRKEKETKKLIDFIAPHISFLNINELEIADNSCSRLIELGFAAKDNISYSVKGSEEMSKKLLGYCRIKNLNAHFCTARLKDRVQMAKRIRRRAKNIALPTDIITREGLLKRGAIYAGKVKLKNASPGFEHYYDKGKNRLLASVKDVKKNAHELKKEGFRPAIVEEYPTYDAFIAECEFL